MLQVACSACHPFSMSNLLRLSGTNGMLLQRILVRLTRIYLLPWLLAYVSGAVLLLLSAAVCFVFASLLSSSLSVLPLLFLLSILFLLPLLFLLSVLLLLFPSLLL